MPMAPPPSLPEEEPLKAAPPPAGPEARDRDSEGARSYITQAELSQLRRIRSEVQELETILVAIQRGESSPRDYEGYLKKTVQDVEGLSLEPIPGENADGMARVNNLWEQLRICPVLVDPGAKLDAQEMQRHLSSAVALCRRMVNEIGNLTIPARIKSWLKNARPGYYVPFHAVFQDEMPDPEARKALLNYLAWAPEALKGGLVDLGSGLIYRYAESFKERLVSYLLLLAGLGIAAAAVVVAPYLPVDGWPLEDNDLGTLLIGWGAILLGLVFHLGVGLNKRAQTEGRPAVLAIGDLPLMLNARSGQILLKVYMTLVGLFGLTFAIGIEEVTPLNGFLIGYALDSVVELFGTTVEQAASARVGQVKTQLGV